MSPRPSVTADQLTAALENRVRVDGEQMSFTDRYGITYSGSSAHITLTVLLRKDVSLFAGNETENELARSAVRWAAALLVEWFTNEDTPERDAAELACLPSGGVARIVAYVATHGRREHLERVGPQTLATYTRHLLDFAHAEEDAAVPKLPQVVDSNGPWLGKARGLPIAVIGPQGQDTVVVHVDVGAYEAISWRFSTGVEFPVEKVNAVLCGELDLGRYLEDNRELIVDHLAYANSRPDDGLNVEATLLSSPPSAPEEPAAEQAPAGGEVSPGEPDSALAAVVAEHYAGDWHAALLAVARQGQIGVATLDRETAAEYFTNIRDEELTDQRWTRIAEHLAGFGEHAARHGAIAHYLDHVLGL